MVDDGIASKRDPLGRASVDAVRALVGLKYLSSAIFLKTHVIVQLAIFEDIYFWGEINIHENLKNFVPQKFLAIR